MKKKFICILVCITICMTFFSITASADMGPKPSVRITFEGLGDELCYGTLLSKYDSTGPASVWDGNEEYAVHSGNYDWAELDYETWKVFTEYEDSDGYYFLQEGWRVDETKELAWTYYPPTTFKILLYFPESDTFIVSSVYERYAFDSYFTVNMSELSGSSDNIVIQAEESYDYSWELISLLVRIVITIALEIVIAPLFGYRKKKQIMIIAGINVVTQIILNILLNIINYSSGYMAFTFWYVVFELIVFAIEALIFYFILYKFSDKQQKRYLATVYAFTANILSFGTGFAIAKLIPGIF